MAENDKINPAEETASGTGVSRRQFLSGIGALGVGAMFGGVFVKGFLLPDETFAVPVSEGYLLVDTKKCSGCDTCMLACATTHHGRAGLSLARIQVQTDPFAAFPEGIVQNQCRQCPSAPCVMACPTGANHVDVEHVVPEFLQDDATAAAALLEEANAGVALHAHASGRVGVRIEIGVSIQRAFLPPFLRLSNRDDEDVPLDAP